MTLSAARFSPSTATALVLLSCFSSRTNAFTSQRPLALTLSKVNQRNNIPGRAPVDVFYVDDESSEEHTTTVVTSRPSNVTPNGPNVEVDLTQVLLNNNNQEGTVESRTITHDSLLQTEQQLYVLRDGHLQEEQFLNLKVPLPEYAVQQDATKAIATAPLLLTEKNIPALPTIKDYRKFALPCCALMLSGPLLSLVDTAFVGLSSTNGIELAALGGATSIFDCLSWFLTFLNVVTTNLYSSALAKGSKEEAEGVVRTGSRVGLTVGLGVMTSLIVFCKPILASYMGPQAAATPGLLAGASTYLMIRALSMPTFLLLGVLQSALLGAKDSVTPLVAIGYSTIINIVGDFLLVNHFGMGIKGAAIATTVAQWAATLALILPARKKLMAEGKLGLLNFQKKSAISTQKFMSLAAPVVALLAGKLGVFGFLTQAAARIPGQPTPLASHQIILTLFCFMCPFVEVINQTAQTFLPPFYAPVKEYIASMKQQNANYKPQDDTVVQKWKAASSKVSTGFLTSCFLVAALVATAGSIVPLSLGHTLTRDVAVQQALKPLSKLLWWSVFLMGPMSATEGILLARHKSWFLATMYMFSTAVFPYALFTFGSGSVAGVWTCFALFQAYRATMQTLRVTDITPRKLWNKATSLVKATFEQAQEGLVS